MRSVTLLACIAGLLSVAFGAFGAHALEGQLSAEGEGWWQTGTLYLMVHATAALGIGLSGKEGLWRVVGLAMALGALLFAATLYAMALGAPRWFGAITPIGGAGMLIGWALAGWSALKR